MKQHGGKILNAPDIILFPIIMRGMTSYGLPDGRRSFTRRVDLEEKTGIVLIGYPPKFGYIDCMQLVMRIDLWIAEGGWPNKQETSDAKVLAEH